MRLDRYAPGARPGAGRPRHPARRSARDPRSAPRGSVPRRRAGAHPERVVRPMELEWLLDLLDAFPGLVRLVTLAPEADPGSRGSGRSSSGASSSRSATRPVATTTRSPRPRPARPSPRICSTGWVRSTSAAPGIIGAALDPRVPLRPTLIGDLVHVHPALVATVFAAGEPILVSDAVATGVDYFDAAVTEAAGAAYLPDGTLTGGVILLDAAVRNVVGLGVDPAVALAAASDRPAAVLGLAAAPGGIELDDIWACGPWNSTASGRTVPRREPFRERDLRASRRPPGGRRGGGPDHRPARGPADRPARRVRLAALRRGDRGARRGPAHRAHPRPRCSARPTARSSGVGREVEDSPALSVWAASFDDVDVESVALDVLPGEGGSSPRRLDRGRRRARRGPRTRRCSCSATRSRSRSTVCSVCSPRPTPTCP